MKQIDSFELSENTTTFCGSLTKKEFINVGNFQNCAIQKLLITDLISTNIETFARFEMTAYSPGQYSSSFIAVLTGEQLDGFINTLTAFNESILLTTPVVYTEVEFVSNDFKVGCYYDEKGKRWIVYFKIKMQDIKSMILVPNDSIEKLIALLQNVKQ